MFFYLLGIYLSIMSGDVKVKTDGIWKDGFPEMELKNGDSVHVIDGKAEIIYDDGTTIVLDSSSLIWINVSEDVNKIYLNFGRIWAKVSKLLKGKAFEIENPVCIAGVRGTEFIVSYDGDSADTEVLEGEVEVREKTLNKIITLKRLERIRMRRRFIGKIQKIDEERFIHWYRWERRDGERIIERIKERKEKREILLERLEILQKRLKDGEIEKKIRELKEEGMNDNELLKLKGEYLIKKIDDGISKIELKIQEVNNLKNEIKSDAERLKILIRRKEIKEAKALFIKIEREIAILRIKGKEILVISERLKIDKEKLEEFMNKIKNRKELKELIKKSQKSIKYASKLLDKIMRWKREYKIFERGFEDIKRKITER